MILINKTYEIVTHESAKDGESADSGFVYENVEFTFRDLVRELEGYAFLSCSHGSGDTGEWVSTEPYQDPYSGEYEAFSLHYSHQNHDKNAKYWRKALKCAGFI
jgi:hypothetical protein